MNIKYNVTSIVLFSLLCINSCKGMGSNREQTNQVEALQEMQIGQPLQHVNLETGVYQDNSSHAQDRYDIRETDKYYITAVYDGHGPSNDVVEYVRENLIQYIIGYLDTGASMLDAINNAFTQTECEIKNQNLKGGTAALVAILDKTTMKLYVANLGDCRAVLCRNENVFELSSDHKPIRHDEKKE